VKRFGLAGLLRVRGLAEQRAAGDLAAANRDLDTIRVRGSRARAALAGAGHDPADAAGLAAIVAARSSLHALLGDLASLHDRAALGAAEARVAHHAARAETVSLEKLHQRHLAAEHADELRAEQAALDEIAIQGWRGGQDPYSGPGSRGQGSRGPGSRGQGSRGQEAGA
jgi:flagellar FliJ protein